MIYEPEAETLPREQLRALQAERLRSLIDYVKQRIPLYRERLADAEPADISSRMTRRDCSTSTSRSCSRRASPFRRPASSRSRISGRSRSGCWRRRTHSASLKTSITDDDLRQLPFTRKDDLRETYPFGMFAVGRDEVIRIHASSGTTGKLTVVGYTAADVDLFARVNARCLAMAGAEPGMALHNAYGYGLFTGGLGLHAGGERLEMAVVPVSGGLTERQLMLIEDLRPDVIACTPSYALTLAQAFAERGVVPGGISLRFAVCGAEPWTDEMRREIDTGLGVASTNIYGLSEVIGPGVSCECVEARAGMHVNEDHFLPEIVAPETGEPLVDGEEGVLVFTTLTKQALPLIRYWTGDITSLSSEPCACGRTLVRMGRIKGRADDMLIIRGVNVYPTQVEAALLQLPELTPNYRIIVSRTGTLDEAEVEVEVARDLVDDPDLRSRAERTLRETIGCSIAVTLKPPGTVPRSEGGKLQRVLDRR